MSKRSVLMSVSAFALIGFLSQAAIAAEVEVRSPS